MIPASLKVGMISPTKNFNSADEMEMKKFSRIWIKFENGSEWATRLRYDQRSQIRTLLIHLSDKPFAELRVLHGTEEELLNTPASAHDLPPTDEAIQAMLDEIWPDPEAE